MNRRALWLDLAILSYVSFTALGGIIQSKQVDILFIPGVFAYLVDPWSLVVFAGFMGWWMLEGNVKEAPLLVLSTAGMYDAMSSILRIPGFGAPVITYGTDYAVWGLMVLVPYLLMRSKFRVRPLFLILPAIILLANVFSPIDLRYQLEALSCFFTGYLYDARLHGPKDPVPHRS